MNKKGGIIGNGSRSSYYIKNVNKQTDTLRYIIFIILIRYPIDDGCKSLLQTNLKMKNQVLNL